MTKEQIKEELRRSACCDRNPLFDTNDSGYAAVSDFRCQGESITSLSPYVRRVFFLLVAEAL